MKKKRFLYGKPQVFCFISFLPSLESLFCSNHFSVGSDMCPQQGKWPWAYHKLGDQDFCYMIIDKLVSDWDKAQAMCNEQGAGLVTIHSEEENAFVRRHIETSGQGRWLGLTTNYKEGGYHWMDGSRMEDPPFLNIKKNTNSPITSTYDYCIEMEESGLWRYIRCSSARSFTCKKPSPSTGFLKIMYFIKQM